MGCLILFIILVISTPCFAGSYNELFSCLMDKDATDTEPASINYTDYMAEQEDGMIISELIVLLKAKGFIK